MECQLDGVTIHYRALGAGKPILLLHGAPLDHHALLGCMEPVFRDREGGLRIYPDLPGMGKSQGGDWIASQDQMLQVILEFIDRVIPDQRFALVGHSYASYLARGIVYHRSQSVNGLFLLVPWVVYDWRQRSVPAKTTLVHDLALLAQLEPDEAEGFAFAAVVQDQKQWARYRREWLPGLQTYDRPFFDRLLEHLPFSFDADAPAEPFLKPTLILTGRQDHISGYRDAWEVLEHFPRATYAVLDRAGHRAQMEQEGLFNALTNEWLDRVEEVMNG
jgi:pimeloyl-ACP methyl ester carboxylesterase